MIELLVDGKQVTVLDPSNGTAIAQVALAGLPKVPAPFCNGSARFLPFGGAYHKAKGELF